MLKINTLLPIVFSFGLLMLAVPEITYSQRQRQDIYKGLPSWFLKRFQLAGRGIDRCLYYGSQCDEPAAKYICQSEGFDGAVKWKWRYTTSTRIIGDGRVCGRNRGDRCGEFTEILCASRVSPGQGNYNRNPYQYPPY